MSSTVLLITYITIIILSIANVIILFFTLFKFFNDKLKYNRYVKAYQEMEPSVLAYVQKRRNLSRKLKGKIKDSYYKKIVLDILLDYSQENNKDISHVFEELDYHTYLINKGEKKLTFSIIKKLGITRSFYAYSILTTGTQDKNFEKCYACYYAISQLNLNQEQKEKVLNSLVYSNIQRDRITEIVENLKFTTEQLVALLEEQTTELGKVVLIRSLKSSSNIKGYVKNFRIGNYLYDESMEVRIATINTLAFIGDPVFLPSLRRLYFKDKAWQVRAAIAKVMHRFSHSEAIGISTDMVNDKWWWVKFNAIEGLSRMGVEGVEALVDVSLTSSDKQSANLAYYILNANNAVYKTVKGYSVSDDE
ncbi:HEAT repeat domain-containing protein [Proteinivorax tanatarense]|uniref:HEAT repeat domain-containing protein n=1 Tax=Proteinivorax tanatarense TaxID=1260629 RepID=A0AAU7VMI9_9FIRM